MLINIFWFQIPFGYAMIWLWLFLLWLYCGVKITLITLKAIK